MGHRVSKITRKDTSMRFGKYLIAFILIIFAGSSVMAQGDYLQRGESGFEADFGYLFNDIVSGYGGQVSFCVDGSDWR